MNTAVIVERFDNAMNIAAWANGLIGDYVPTGCGLDGVIVNSIMSLQVIANPSISHFLVVVLVEVWCPGTDENDPA